MKFTLNWLKYFLDTNATVEEISTTLTMIGLEVEKIEDKSAKLKDFAVAQIIEATPHPDADKLKVCKVKTINETLQIVCGASNAREGINVVLAPVASVIPTNDMKIKKSKIRGVESCGMLCSASELGIGDNDEGIIELEKDDSQIGEKISKIFGLDDITIEIAITPNRGDCLGVYGIARDLAAAGIGTLKKLDIKENKNSFDANVSLDIKNSELCHFFAGKIFKDIKNVQSPNWLKEKLIAIDVKPISAIVDITNYISYSFGQPMHAYDLNQITGNLSVRSANNNEKITVLNDKEYNLDSNMLVIADDKKSLSIAGIMGGLGSSCNDNTDSIFLEVASFNPINIARTGRKLELITDSRYRFERGVDREFSLNALNIATNLIIEICGGKISNTITSGDNKTEETIIDFDFSLVKKRTGIEINKDESIKIVNHLGFKIYNDNKVKVPSFRSDVTIKEDLVEEIVRIFGYDNIPTFKLPEVKNNSYSKTIDKVKTICDSLLNKGLDELVTWSFVSDKKANFFTNLDENLQLKNPISINMSYMRPSIFPNLIDTVAKNTTRGNSDLSFFESGLIYNNCSKDGQIKSIAGLRSGKFITRNIHENQREVDVFDSKSDLMFALESVNVATENINVTEETPQWYHPNRSGCVKLGKNILGYFGEIHPTILREFGIKQTIVAFEIFPDAINLKKKKTTSKPKLELNDLQSSIRDFAFTIDKNIAVQEVVKAVKSSDKKLIDSVNIFDVYQGSNVEEDKKSIAISISIQPLKENLTDNNITQISEKVINAVTKIGGELRK